MKCSMAALEGILKTLNMKQEIINVKGKDNLFITVVKQYIYLIPQEE